jgi:hypothetical protein
LIAAEAPEPEFKGSDPLEILISEFKGSDPLIATP